MLFISIYKINITFLKVRTQWRNPKNYQFLLEDSKFKEDRNSMVSKISKKPWLMEKQQKYSSKFHEASKVRIVFNSHFYLNII